MGFFTPRSVETGFASALDGQPLGGPPLDGRRRWLAGLGGAGLLALAGCSTTAPPVARSGRSQVPAFSAAAPLGELPEGWRPHVTRPDRPRTRYQLDRAGERTVLHALADGTTSGLRCDLNIDPQQQPWLQWDWRVDSYPSGATVAEDELDDSPARVILAFEGDHQQLSLRDRLFEEQVALFTDQQLPFATLAYVWDGEAAPGSVFTYPRSSRIRYLVVDSGPQGTGRWQRHRRNVRNDYLRIFGSEPGRITSIGVLTDSDDLKGPAEAWFGDLAFA